MFDHLRGNLTAADLMSQGVAAAALSMAERTFPVLEAVAVEDPAPLARPPRLGAVPPPSERPASADPRGLTASVAAIALGAGGLAAARRREAHGGRAR